MIQRIEANQGELCADLKLVDGKLKYTRIYCYKVRKPLCMKGEPTVQSSSEEARFSKLRHLKSHRNKLLSRKQKVLKARLKLLNESEPCPFCRVLGDQLSGLVLPCPD